MHKLNYNLSAAIMTLGLLLGSWNDHVALFMQNDSTPLEVYPVKLTLLPQADQKALHEGIPVESSESLRKLLEDLLS